MNSRKSIPIISSLEKKLGLLVKFLKYDCYIGYLDISICLSIIQDLVDCLTYEVHIEDQNMNSHICITLLNVIIIFQQSPNLP